MSGKKKRFDADAARGRATQRLRLDDVEVSVAPGITDGGSAKSVEAAVLPASGSASSFSTYTELPDPADGIHRFHLAAAEQGTRWMHGGAKFVRLSDLAPSPHQVRLDYGDIPALAEQIVADGMTDVPVVRLDDPRYPGCFVLVDGHRRFRAVQHLVRLAMEEDALAGRLATKYDPHIPVLVAQMDDAAASIATLTSNEGQRLHALERARQVLMVAGVAEAKHLSISRQGDSRPYADRDIAKQTGRSRSLVSEQLLVGRNITDQVLMEASVHAMGDAGELHPRAEIILDAVQGLTHDVLYRAAGMLSTEDRAGGINLLTQTLRRLRDHADARARHAANLADAEDAKRREAAKRAYEMERYSSALASITDANLDAARRGGSLLPLPQPPAWTAAGRKLAEGLRQKLSPAERGAALRQAYDQASDTALAIRSRKPIGRHSEEEAFDAIQRAAPQLLRLAERTTEPVVGVEIPMAGEVFIITRPTEDATIKEVRRGIDVLGVVIDRYVRRANALHKPEMTDRLAASLEGMLTALRVVDRR